jgi:hypothetical protein
VPQPYTLLFLRARKLYLIDRGTKNPATGRWLVESLLRNWAAMASTAKAPQTIEDPCIVGCLFSETAANRKIDPRVCR